MTTYTVIKEFTLVPANIHLQVSDTLVKYADSVLVKVNTSSFTSSSFYEWVGSVNSEPYLEKGETVPDAGGGSITPIDPNGHYTTTDIVNKINEIAAKV